MEPKLDWRLARRRSISAVAAIFLALGGLGILALSARAAWPVSSVQHPSRAPIDLTVEASMLPSTVTVKTGTVFTLELRIAAGSQPVDAVDAVVQFPTTTLEAITLVPGATLPVVLMNKIDHAKGIISYSAGVLPPGSPATGEFTLVQMRFRAKASTPPQGVSTSCDGTAAFSAGQPVLRTCRPATVIITETSVCPKTCSPPDDTEPNDSFNTAHSIATDGMPEFPRFDGPCDIDWFKFPAVAAASYVIQTSRLRPKVDTVLTLYDQSGTGVLAQDDNGGGGLASRIVWTAPASGVYYVSVRHTDPAYDPAADKCQAVYPLQVATGALAPPFWDSFYDFASTQGISNWHYQYWDGGAYRDMTWGTNAYGLTSWRASDDTLTLQVDGALRPARFDAVRGWRSSGNGPLRVAGHYGRFNANGDGIDVSIWKGATRLWEQTLADTTPANYDLNTTITADDWLYFRANKRSSDFYDDTSFRATVLSLPTSGPALTLVSANQTVFAGDIFTVELRADTGTASADTVDAYVDFDPRYLGVVDAAGNPATSIELNTAVFGSATYNSVDNAAGRISFSASKFASPYLTGQFKAATIRFRAKAPVATTSIVFARSGARWSDLLRSGQSLNPTLNDAKVAIPLELKLNGRVTLEQRGPEGNPRWITPLYRMAGSTTVPGITAYQADTLNVLGTYTATTDARGVFAANLTGLSSGTYDIEVKGADTLSNKKCGVALPSAAQIDFGTLLVGDCTGDNVVKETDVSYMVVPFLLCSGSASFRPYADVNKDGCINGTDVSAFIPNFLRSGPISLGACPAPQGEQSGTPARLASDKASLALSPASKTVDLGGIFVLDIIADTGSSSADTVGAYLTFNPAYLQVVDAAGNAATTIEVNMDVFSGATFNSVNNLEGRIDFAATRFSSPYLTGSVRVATIRFKAVAPVPTTGVGFVRSGARRSDLALDAQSLSPTLIDGVVSITEDEVPEHPVYLPVLVR